MPRTSRRRASIGIMVLSPSVARRGVSFYLCQTGNESHEGPRNPRAAACCRLLLAQKSLQRFLEVSFIAQLALPNHEHFPAFCPQLPLILGVPLTVPC